MNSQPAPFRILSNLEVVLCIGVASTVYVLLRFTGSPGLGVAAGAMAGVLISSLGMSWPLRKRLWFWVSFAALVVPHLLIALYINWSIASRWTGFAIMPFMAADTLLTMTVIYTITRVIYGKSDRLFVTDDSLS